MRIAVVSHEYPPLGGGASTAVQATARALVRQGHQVLVLTAGAGGLPDMETDAGVTIERLPSLRMRSLAPSAFELLSFCASARLLLRNRLSRFGAEGVIAYFAVPAGAFAVPAASALGIPVLVSLRGSDVPGFADGRLSGRLGRLVHPSIRKALRGATAVVPNSPVLARLIADFMPELSDQLTTVRNGIDAGLVVAAPARSGTDDVVWVQVGQLIERKRPAHSIRAVAHARAAGRPVRLLLVGEGPLRADLEALVSELGIGDHVAFLGRLDRGEIPIILRNADLFVMPSVAEGMSNALLEGLAAGLPAVVARNGSDDLIVESGGGVVLEPDDLEGYQAATLELSGSPDRRLGLAERGLTFVRGLTWDACAAAMAKLLGAEQHR